MIDALLRCYRDYGASLWRLTRGCRFAAQVENLDELIEIANDELYGLDSAAV